MESIICDQITNSCWKYQIFDEDWKNSRREQLDQLQDAQNDAIANIFAGGSHIKLKSLYAKHKLLNVS